MARGGEFAPLGAITEFPIGTKKSSPKGIVAAPDGNLWFTDLGTNRIGRVTMTGEVKDYAVGGGYRQLQGIAAGPDGNVWFTETHANTVSRHTLDRSSAEGKP